MKRGTLLGTLALCSGLVWPADDLPKPYSAPCTERESVFEFTEKPAVKELGNDKYQITFAVRGHCDVTIGIVDENGFVVRHLASGVLGPNAPAPFQKNTLKQSLSWDGKDDLDSYPKSPERLKVRVMLGLKPEFDKRLGGTSPKNLPGRIWGIASGETGVFVMTFGQRFYIRKFDHDGNYLQSLAPPQANLPESKLDGMGYAEFEPGRRGVHFPGNLNDTVSVAGNFLPTGPGATGGWNNMSTPVVVGDRLFYMTVFKDMGPFQRARWTLNHVNVDGSTSLDGCRPTDLFPLTGAPWDTPANAKSLSCAVSPDARRLYFVGCGFKPYAVWRRELDGDKPGETFLGGKEPSSAEGKFSETTGLDCDAQGRLYVCDSANNRVQVFSPEGKFLKSISADRPRAVAIHRKTGAVYLLHSVRVEGKSVGRLTKHRSFEDPTPTAQMHTQSDLMTLDSWTSKPRLWMNGRSRDLGATNYGYYDVTIWEEDGNTFKKISDFSEEARKEDGANHLSAGGWSTKVVCDPMQEQVYVQNSIRFDLKTGALLGHIRTPGQTDDIAFDKRGYLHLHFNPGFFQPGVGRVDPRRASEFVDSSGQKSPRTLIYGECPYDYGVEGKGGWRGILPVRDQPGAKYFQDGLGVNMRGDVAEQCNIYYAPKHRDDATSFALEGGKGTAWGERDGNNYAAFQADILRRQQAGEEVYWIRPKPGVPLMGATVWTFEWNGELRDECAVIEGSLINGVMLDESGALYFVCQRTRMFEGQPFLAGRGGLFGLPHAKLYRDPFLGTLRNPFTGTLIKTKGKATLLSSYAPIKMEERPARPPELHKNVGSSIPEMAWCEGAEWLYAGASPIVPGGCSCPTMRFHTDWYKRSFVPEAYRHSIGVLDANGNLLLHIGRYGNFDSGSGPKSKIPVGGDQIAVTFNRFVSATDNHLVFDDHGERLVVLKLNYHAEETVPIVAK